MKEDDLTALYQALVNLNHKRKDKMFSKYHQDIYTKAFINTAKDFQKEYNRIHKTEFKPSQCVLDYQKERKITNDEVYKGTRR